MNELRRKVVPLAALAAGGILMGGPGVRADVSWEHVATVRSSKNKKVTGTFKLYNQWTPQRHRVLLKFAIPYAPDMSIPAGVFPTTAFAPSVKVPSIKIPKKFGKPKMPKLSRYGGVTWIDRLDDDRWIAFSSEDKSYISESRRGLLKRARFDPWTKLEPRLSHEAPPPFTLQQRRRLGAEIRAATSPWEKKALLVFFRPLPGTHTVNGIEGHGYRMTWLINTGGFKPKDAQWMRVKFEWWLAGELEGDDEVRQFTKASEQVLHDVAWPSTSLWINEIMPVLWQAMPEGLIQAAETLVPPDTSPHAGFGGTPLRLEVTLEPPPVQRSQFGDVTFTLALTRRDTTPLPAAIWDAPSDYKRLPLDPKLKQLDKYLHPKIARGDSAPTSGPIAAWDDMGFTWQAWNEYMHALKQATPGLP